MKIAYVLNFRPRPTGGKELAAYYKIKAMKTIFGEVNVFYPRSNLLFIQALEYFFIELRVLMLIVLRQADFVVCRGVAGAIVSLIFRNRVIREIHADLEDELALLKKNSLKFRVIAFVNKCVELKCRAHIYNNPRLVNHYIRKGFRGESLVCYNGIDPEALAGVTMPQPSIDYEYVVFTGSCSIWHDLVMVERFAKALQPHGIRVIVAGGAFSSDHVVNITPASNECCLSLIKGSLGCIVFINDIRVSPGNALKLYEYMGMGRPIISHADLEGYSDELEGYGGAVLCDREIVDIDGIVSFLRNSKGKHFYRSRPFSWETRMMDWNEFFTCLR